MRKASCLISSKIGKLLSWSMIACIALSMLVGSWPNATSHAYPDESALQEETVAPEATSSTFVFNNPASINIVDNAPAVPYPSNITVTGVPSTIEKVTVRLNNLSHTFPADFRILLVAPTGHNLVLMGNVGGGNDVQNATLTFDDAATTGLPGTIVTGTYKPTSQNNNPTFLAPAPSGPYGNPQTAGSATLASAFAGRAPNGVWSLYVYDAVGADVGSMAGGWTLTIINSITAQNTEALTIPDSGAASLYPSNLNITGLIGSISSITVLLYNLSHTAPDDVDLLLVSPGGRRVVLVSDVGGVIPITNVNLTLEDSAPNSLPDDGPLVSGTFKPTNIEAGDAFPAPAPAGPVTGNTLAAFNGANPNGTWSLYLVDDNGNNAGSLSGGWAVAIGTSTTACSLNLSSTLQVFPITGGTGTFDVITPFGCDWTATSLSSFIAITAGSSGSGGTEPVSFTVEPNMGGGRTGTIRVVNGGVTRDIDIQQPSGCPFALSQTTQQFSSIGGAGNVQVTAAGACGWSAMTKDNWITINSGPGTGNGTVSFTVAPNTTNAARTGTVFIGARVLTIMQARAIARANFDFDGDAKADVAVFRPGVSTWYVSNSSNGSASSQQFGLATDKLAPADYDADARTDIAVFRDGTWHIVNSTNGALRTDQWGLSGDIAMPADYDGDNKADLAVFRPSNGTWYILKSSDGLLRSEQFGTNGDRPVMGDFDGDGKADIAVFRPSTGAWYILRSSDGAIQAYSFGLSTDTLTPADYDGDNKTDIAVFRPGDGTWYLLRSTAGLTTVQFGVSTDVAVPADYDGDAKADIAIFRQGFWHILQSTNGTTRTDQWGANGDSAVPSAFISN